MDDGEGDGGGQQSLDLSASADVLPRSNRPEVRNPLLALAAAAEIANLPADSRRALRSLLMELRKEAHRKAEHSWRSKKAPIAVYYRAVGVYAGHIARLARDKPTSQKK